jgi:hypothetical protein
VFFPLVAQHIRESLLSLQFLNLRLSVGLLGRGISPSQGRFLSQIQKKLEDIHALSGIRTHFRSVRASKGISCLKPRVHYVQPYGTYCIKIRVSCTRKMSTRLVHYFANCRNGLLRYGTSQRQRLTHKIKRPKF